MIEQVTFCDFTERFNSMGRGEQFTYQGLRALYDYFEQYEDETGETINLDVIALCCEYSEYESLEEFQGDYDTIPLTYESIEDIEDHTQVIRITDNNGVEGDSFIIQCF